jgi:hypothetical protein
MAGTLRMLLIQRAARLQGRPAFTAPEWGTLDWARFRNRVEGIALGLLSAPCPPGTPVKVVGAGPWAWAAEVAAACSGLAWSDEGAALGPDILGGARFNSEEGRGPYHDRDAEFGPSARFHGGLGQGEVLRRLARLNDRIGWDHETALALPLEAAPTAEGRAALWSALYAGAHAALLQPDPRGARGFIPFEPGPFAGFWDPEPGRTA